MFPSYHDGPIEPGQIYRAMSGVIMAVNAAPESFKQVIEVNQAEANLDPVIGTIRGR